MEKVKRTTKTQKQGAQALRNIGKMKLQKFSLKAHLLTEDEKAIAVRLKSIMNAMLENWDNNTKQIVDATVNHADTPGE